MKKAVKVIAIIYTVIDVIGFIICCIALFKGMIWESLLLIASLAVNLILLWSLYLALDKIDVLEEYVLKIRLMLEKSNEQKTVEKEDKIYRKCEYCGAILYTTEKKCPKCKHPYDE